MFCSARSAELKAVMLIGVACTVESRFSAVTTISVSESADGAAAGSVWAPAGSVPKDAAVADAPRRKARTGWRPRPQGRLIPI
jgi:hypothetical protein